MSRYGSPAGKIITPALLLKPSKIIHFHIFHRKKYEFIVTLYGRLVFDGSFHIIFNGGFFDYVHGF